MALQSGSNPATDPDSMASRITGSIPFFFIPEFFVRIFYYNFFFFCFIFGYTFRVNAAAFVRPLPSVIVVVVDNPSFYQSLSLIKFKLSSVFYFSFFFCDKMSVCRGTEKAREKGVSDEAQTRTKLMKNTVLFF